MNAAEAADKEVDQFMAGAVDILAGSISATATVHSVAEYSTDAAGAPVPKPRSQIKHTDSYKNLAALAEQSDSISLRSLDITDDFSKTEEPSTELSIKSQLRDLPTTNNTANNTTTTTTTTTASEDHTESYDPTSEISVDETETETQRSELGDNKNTTTSFYIGESSRNIITKTTPNKSGSETLLDELSAGIAAQDVQLMQEASVDDDEANDVFKEYITMKHVEDDDKVAALKIMRQSSETRNDLLEESPATDQVAAHQPQKPTEHTISSSLDMAHSTSEDLDESIKEISEITDIECLKTTASVVMPVTLSEEASKMHLPLEKSEWEISEKDIPKSQPKVVHSPQQPLTKESLIVRTIEEAQQSLEAATKELTHMVKGISESLVQSPTEYEFRTIAPTAITAYAEHKPETDDISSFIGIPEGTAAQKSEAFLESLNREAAIAHYGQSIFAETKRDVREESGSLGFVSTGTAEDYSSTEDHAAKEEHASLGFISTETAEDFSSMEEYYQEKLAKASELKDKDDTDTIGKSSTETFGEISTEPTMKPFDVVVHRVKTESSSEASNRWSVPELDNSSSSESFYKSYEKSQSRPLSSDVDNMLTAGTSSEYQTARDGSSVFRETTEYVSAVSTLESTSAKTISSHESMKSLDSQSSTNLGSIDVSELSETLVASSTETDALEAEELANLRDLHKDDDDSEDSLEAQVPPFDIMDQQMHQSMMKRSQEMIFKPKETKTELVGKLETETVKFEEFPKAKEAEKTWGLAYPVDEARLEDTEKPEEILFYSGDVRRSIDESKLASSLDDGSMLSVSMSSTSNVETVVENFEELIGSAGSSSLTGIEGFGFSHDEHASSLPEDTFVMELENKDQSPQDSEGATPPGEPRRRGHKRHESTAIAADALKALAEAESGGAGGAGGDAKESESESDTDPYESEYTRQFRTPSERKGKKKKAAAAEMDHGFEPEKRPFTPSQLVAEVIVEDSATEELEAEALMVERRPSQNMHDYSNIPDIMVTEDTQKTPILEEEVDDFQEQALYKVKTQEELHKADDAPLHQSQAVVSQIDAKEEQFQKLVQEQYKQKLAELKHADISDTDFDDHKAPDSPDSFEMVEQPDISDEFVIIEEVAKEANEVDLGGKSIKIKPTKYESKHDEEVEKIIIKSAPADPKLGSQIYRDDLNFEFEESPPTAGSSSGDQQDESESSDIVAANKRWVEMQLSDSQLRYPYDITGGVLEDIKEEDGEFEVGSSRISSFKDSFSSTPEYARRFYARGEHDDISLSSLQEFESLEQAISLENRNKMHQGSTDSSNGSFTRRFTVRHTGSGTAQGDDISVSSLKEFEGLENACFEAHLIEIKAKEEAALLSRSDESNKSNGSDRGNGAVSNAVVTKVTRTITRTEVPAAQQQQNIEQLLKQKLEECESKEQQLVRQIESTTELVQLELKTTKIESQESEKDSIDSMEISKSHDVMTSSIDSFDISKDATTRSDIDSLEVDRKQPTREESIDSIENEQMDFMSKFVSGGATLGDGLTTTTTTTTTSMDADGHEHTVVTRIVTTTTTASTAGEASGALSIMEMPVEAMTKDISVDSLNLCMEQTTSSAGTTATYQTSAGNSQMSGSVTSCASSTLMEDSYPTPAMSGSSMSASYWSHEEPTAIEAPEEMTMEAANKAAQQTQHKER